MTGDRRKPIPVNTQTALWAISNGNCYAPGCPEPTVREIRPGHFRKNAQIAHIYGVQPGAARYRRGMPESERDNFKNLLLLCYPHHVEIDDEKTGEMLYPAPVLLEWKAEAEGTNGPALTALPPLDDSMLEEYLLDVFEEPLDRLREIADQLEATGKANTATVLELKTIIGVISRGQEETEQRRLRTFAEAAEIVNSSRFHSAIEVLDLANRRLSPGNLEEFVRGLSSLLEALKDAIRRAQRYM